MCRLLAFAAPTSRPLAAAVGDVQMAVFCAMARLHDDGWGAAWTDGLGGDDGSVDSPDAGDGAVSVERSPRSGYQDPALEALTAGTSARAGLLHLRLASSGMPVAPENTHPFLAGGVAVAHNGAAKPVARLEALLPETVRRELRGSTDSERYAALIRLRAAELGDLAAGAAVAAGQLAPLFPASSLNALVLSARELVVVHSSAGARIPHEDFDASGLAEEELPIGHRTGYYQLWQRRCEDGTVVFSSSGLRTDGWEPLAPSTVVAVDLRTLEQRVLPVTDGPAAPAAVLDLAGTGARVPAPGGRSRADDGHDSHERVGGSRVGG